MDTMYIANTKPWDGLGKLINEKMTIDEMVAAAVEVPDFLAITRDTDGHVFQMATSRYHAIQNAEIMEVFRHVAEIGELRLETAGSMNFSSRHTQVRVVCRNTFQMALRGSRAVKRALGLSRDSLRRYKDVANQLVEVQVDPDGQEVMRYVAAIFDPELLEKSIEKTMAQDNGMGSDLVTARNTWWGVFNGVTEYVDHQAGRSRDTGLASAWFGPGARRKEKALELALAAAERMR